MAVNDDELVAILGDCGRGNQVAFEKLYRLAAPKLFSLCKSLLRREALAEEALQETFLQIWRDCARFDQRRAKPMTWMGVIARHRCLDLLRRRRPEYHQPDDPAANVADSAAGPLELTLRWSDRHDLVRCLEQLTEPQRLCITMAFLRDFSHQQLSEHLATPLGTVKSWIRRGLTQLKGCLQS